MPISSVDCSMSFTQIRDFMKQRVTTSATARLIEIGFCYVRSILREVRCPRIQKQETLRRCL
jgi:hypothetical protein